MRTASVRNTAAGKVNARPTSCMAVAQQLLCMRPGVSLLYVDKPSALTRHTHMRDEGAERELLDAQSILVPVTSGVSSVIVSLSCGSGLSGNDNNERLSALKAGESLL